MKILCEYADCAPSFVRAGWLHAFSACQHEAAFWDPRRKSAFDVFSEFEPDIFIGTSYGVTRALAKCITIRPAMKVAFFGSAWGPLINSVDLAKYPLVVPSDEEKRTLEKLKRETERPNFIFIHVSDRYLEPCMSGWRSIGITPIGVLNAADTFIYHPMPPSNQFKTDAVFCGNRWPYKAQNIDKYLLPLCHPSSGLKLKIFGSAGWPVHNWVGTISQEDEAIAYSSAAVCLNVSEPHSTDPALGFDIVERIFKTVACGGFLVTDHVNSIVEDVFTHGEVITAKTPEEYSEKVHYFVKHPEERHRYTKAAQKKVLYEHTYFERIQNLFAGLDLHDEAQKVSQVKALFLKGINCD